MRREPCKEFRQKRIEKYYLSKLYSSLVNKSQEKLDLDNKKDLLKRMLKDIIKESIIDPEIMKLFNNAQRIAKKNCSGIRLHGPYFGLDSSYPAVKDGEYRGSSVNVSQSFSFKSEETDFPPISKGNNEYWRTLDIKPEMIRSEKDIAKIKIVLMECAKAEYALNQYLKEYGRGYEFLRPVMKGEITYGKLFDLNPDWFDELIEIQKIPEGKIYGEGKEVGAVYEDGVVVNSFQDAVKRLKKVLM